MSSRKLFLLRLKTDDLDQVADLFAEHDRGPTPRDVGLTRRTLFRFHDLYMHLVEGADDIPRRLAGVRTRPDFLDLSARLDEFLEPYAPSQWQDLHDSAARPFYEWTAQ